MAKPHTIESLKAKFHQYYTVQDRGYETRCWIWNKPDKTTGGYGKISIRGKMVYAHRVSFMAFNGEIPDGLDVCHRCDIKPCVNPDHLFAGTHTENIHDAMSKGLIPAMRGERNGLAKLTEHQVREIRARFDSKKWGQARVLAREFGVDVALICRIAHRQCWKHVE